MNENFITRFEVSNFKKFDHLVLENIGQVNLITGDNNVGKTCLLEALTINVNAKSTMSILLHMLLCRGFHYNTRNKNKIDAIVDNQKFNVIGFSQKDISKPILVKRYSDKVNFVSIKNEVIDVINTENDEIRNFAKRLEKYPEINSLSKNWILYYLDDELKYMIDVTSKYYNQFLNTEGLRYVNFIALNFFFSNNELIEYYTQIIKDVEEKKNLIEIINNVFRSIEIVDIQQNIFHDKQYLSVATTKRTEFHSINLYGDGFVRLFRIVLEIMMCSGNSLMIDEIDTGVHYLKMKDEWNAIFKLAKQTQTQIFATTHSLDCIKAFIEAGNENPNIKEDLRLIELEEFTGKAEENKISATTYDYNTFKFKIEAGTNIRGGNVWQ